MTVPGTKPPTYATQQLRQQSEINRNWDEAAPVPDRPRFVRRKTRAMHPFYDDLIYCPVNAPSGTVHGAATACFALGAFCSSEPLPQH